MTPKRGPRRVDDRLRRLLVMLPWLVERGEVSTAEMAAHFSLTVPELVADLEKAATCGLPPFLDELIDVVVDEETVAVGIPRLFTRPFRLTAPEAFALVTAARAALALPGAEQDGPLARAVAKLEQVVGAVPVEVELDAPSLIDELADAVTDGAVLQLRYFSVNSGASSERDVEPLKVFSDRGHWYLLAHDRSVGEQRIFRADRIEDLARTGDHFEPPVEVVVPEWFDGSSDAVRVRLRLDAVASWVAESYPVVEVTPIEGSDGGLEVVLAVVSERWLGRLLVRLGRHAEVVEPAEWRDLAARTAAPVLARYG
jgi:proteasome accessory factor C